MSGIENQRYARYSIYSNRDTKKDASDSEKTHSESSHKEVGLFLVNGKPDFSDLNFSAYGWKRKNVVSPKNKKFIESTPGYKDYKETIIYEGPQGLAVVHANRKKDRHKITIYLNDSKDDPLKMDTVKFMFQSEWGLIFKEIKEENSDLIKKIESN